MKRRVALLSVLATLAADRRDHHAGRRGPRRSPTGPKARLQMYTVLANQADAKAIKSGGYDIASVAHARAAGSGSKSWRTLPSRPRSRSSDGPPVAQRRRQDLCAARRRTEGGRLQGLAGLRRTPMASVSTCIDLEAANEDILDLEVRGMTYGTDPEGDGPNTPREIIALRLSAGDVEGPGDDGSSLRSCTPPRSTHVSGSPPRSTVGCSSGSSRAGARRSPTSSTS